MSWRDLVRKSEKNFLRQVKPRMEGEAGGVLIRGGSRVWYYMPNKGLVKPKDNKMNIRQAVSTDSLLLSSLCMDVQSLHAKHYPDLFKMPDNNEFAISFFNGMLADPMTTIFIAEEDGQALGYIMCKLVERPENPFKFATRYLDVDQISVYPAAQGRGIGTELITQAGILAKNN